MKWQDLIFGTDAGLVDVDAVEVMLSGQIASDLVEEYYRFGALVLSEVQNMASQIDGKLTTVLGLASGILISLLFGTTLNSFAPIKTPISVAASFALIALVLSAFGLMSRMWRLPSARDWFKEGLSDSDRLRKYHIVSLLAAQQQHVRLIGSKSRCLHAAEVSTALSALIVAGILFNAALS
jgi:hypothetical protein